MIPYIIINGKSSKDVNGLLIQTLPPISKPPIRTLVDEIDGRDGDVVTTLGYGAYNKTFEIGLYGDYNVDDVIAFFNQSGVVTFSNELDKYYNFAIYEQIDLERLIKFRTATVTMHVQPFKFSTVDKAFILSKDNLIELPNFTLTKDGVTAVVNNGVITISGTHTEAVGLLIPCKSISLPSGAYEVRALANSSSTFNDVDIKVVNNTPNDSLGGYAILENGETVTIDATLTTTKTYNYIYIGLNDSNVNENFTLSVGVYNTTDNGEISVINRGNIYSKPKFIIAGSGLINLYLNGIQVLAIALGNLGEITIDAAGMNAYNGNTYLNRLVTGNYDNLRLQIGTNTISWDGNITSIEVVNFSRWI